MKLFFRRPATSLILALFAAAPVAVLSSCSGGGSGPLLQTATRAGTFVLPTNEVATLSLLRKGNALSGTLYVAPSPDPPPIFYGPHTGPVKSGTYIVNGQINTDGTFSVAGTMESVGFTLSGVLPTQTDAGSYKLNIGGTQGDGGDNYSGTLPSLASPTPAPTRTAPTVLSLTTTPSAGANYTGSGFTSLRFDQSTVGGASTISAHISEGGFRGGVYLEVPGLGTTVGSTLSFSPDSTQTTVSLNDVPYPEPNRIFHARGGTITLSEIMAGSAKITFKDVVFSAPPSDAYAHGSVTINGTASGPLYR